MQRPNVIRPTGCLQCSSIRIGQHYSTSPNRRAAASEILPRSDSRLSKINPDLRISWRELRNKALDSFPSDTADGGTPSSPSAARETFHQDVTERQATDARRKTAKLRANRFRAGGRNEKITIQSISNKYIEALNSNGSNNDSPAEVNNMDEIIRVFDLNTLQVLSKKGYSPEDIMAWAWILTTKDSTRAALRLLYWGRQHIRQTPLFVVSFLLHRVTHDVRAFRIILAFSLSYLTQQPLADIAPVANSDVTGVPNIPSSEQRAVAMQAPKAYYLTVLLLQRARQLWPETQFSIAEAFAYYLIHVLPRSYRRKLDHWRINVLRAKYFNWCLNDLSIPSKRNPFIYASTQQRAQFVLLKAMATHEPVLPVSRRGYQAVAAVQLAHKKTLAEKVFAEQKALSWPPWKEARMGIDSARGNDGMKSRTMQVLSQMTEAGYSHGDWEDAVGILAGWDTDGSPTIQTRSLQSRSLLANSKKKGTRVESALWAARIQATRTLREAWACFISYEARYAIPTERIFHAMAKKLIYSQAQMKKKATTPTRNRPLPGDGPEVFPEPSSARDAIYIAREPPSLENLLKQMTMQGVRPGNDFIALLLQRSQNFSTGIKFVCAFLRAKQVRALCTLWTEELDKEALDTLNAMHPRLFDSFIVLLCTHFNSWSSRYRVRRADLFPILMRVPQMNPVTSTLCYHEDMFRKDSKLGHPQTLSHAVKLLKTLKPRRMSAWLPLLKALASLRGSAKEILIDRKVQWFLMWYEVAEAIRWMRELELEPGTDGLMMLCRVFSRAVYAGARDVTIAEEALYLVSKYKRRNDELQLDNAATFEEFVYKGIQLLKSYFDRLVYPLPPFSAGSQNFALSPDKQKPAVLDLPNMLEVPNLATLHALVRALGLSKDHDGILNLLQWMSYYAPDLISRADENGNGKTMMRRTLTAIRVFLEGSIPGRMRWHELESASSKNGRGDEENRPVSSYGHIEEARKLIEGTEGWGSWPSDDEVRAYGLTDAEYDFD
ncbi:hypothetical protein UA08_01513 [Talaromyces atroroseus]|uniref:Uncharacterized protein n=1 Tax=Talaromyces atroroseus TaxID=1441469 RepID=A0A1Q5QBU3_TALAT|nr:hypothetical protein UA08_01513 [Talaromyces atroroseus]OKL63390.1 hypothetical protein UA08_01513 [Talaromyces atroroseus]